MPKRYRKKPVEIEAGLLKESNIGRVAAWCGGTQSTFGDGIMCVEIPTLEGTMRADIGDYIIKGVKDEFYPCKPDIFAVTYELVE